MNNVSEIAKLNDEFRANPSLGTLILTEGIRSNTHDDIATIINKVRNFNDFDEDNNPYGTARLPAAHAEFLHRVRSTSPHGTLCPVCALDGEPSRRLGFD